MEEKTITPREQMFIIVSAIILAGLAANYSTPPSIPLARGLAKELLDSILKDQKVSE